MKVAILSPHLDDAVLSCWHVLEGRDAVTVVNVFTGSPSPSTQPAWWDRETGALDSVVRMQERREEDSRALELVGRSAVHMDLLDAQYRTVDPPTGHLVARLRALLEPRTVLHAPAGLSGHPDHLLVRAAALELARAGWQVTLYADLPHGIRDGWPAWVAVDHQRVGLDVGEVWARVLSEAGVAVERLVPRVRPLDHDTRRRKLRALAEYRTQRPALDHLAFVALEDPRALAFEVGWEVPASALGGSLERRAEPLVTEAGGEVLHDGR